MKLMIRFLGISLFFCLFSIVAIAQNATIKGTVKDNIDQTPVRGATVIIFLQQDSARLDKKTVVTDATGSFVFSNTPQGNFFVEISSVGYEQIKKEVVNTGGVNDLGTIQLAKKGKDLEVVTVVSQAPPVKQKGDTSEFSASQFKVNPDATTEDLIKKMPGVTVDRSGNVTAQGEQIKKVTIDGKDFFGDDASAALKICHQKLSIKYRYLTA
jgi:hypothetical protein